MKNANSRRQLANSTYAVLVHSEQEERSAFEGAVYLLFFLSAIFSMWQVARQPITVPVDSATQCAAIAQTLSVSTRASDRDRRAYQHLRRADANQPTSG